MASPATSAGRLRMALAAGVVLCALAAAFAYRVMSTAGAGLADDPGAARGKLSDLLVVLVIGAGLSGFVVALAAGWLAVAPLGDLTRAVHGMRHDPGIRSGVRGGDEVGQLGEALDMLAGWVASEKRSLEQDRDRLATILESMSEGVLVTDAAHGNIVLTNAALREMLVLGRVNMTGRPPAEAIRVDGLDDILRRARVSAEGASGEIELGGLRPRRLLVRAAPLRADAGRGPSGLVVVFNDVTDLRRLETMRRDFVANVSHELRTPIAAIRGAAETLHGGAAADPSVASEFIAIVARNAERLQRLVEDLLDLSRIEARKWQLAIQPVDPRAAVAVAIESVSALGGGRSTFLGNAHPARIDLSSRNSFHNDVDTALGPVLADPRALERVLVNLFENAIKHAPGANVHVSASRDGDLLVLRIRDDGPGIAQRHLPRLFERFYRVDAGRSRAVGGTGLGLSIVKHLVEAMGGTIDVESRVGQGTAFSVTLPTAQHTAA